MREGCFSKQTTVGGPFITRDFTRRIAPARTLPTSTTASRRLSVYLVEKTKRVSSERDRTCNFFYEIMSYAKRSGHDRILDTFRKETVKVIQPTLAIVQYYLP
jgi:hypothetical protein